MTMLPALFPYTDETTVSWCSRLARFHTNLACPNFLKMVEISQADVMGLKNPTVERLSNLTGVPGAQIMACGPQYAGDHLLTYKGETFGTKFMTRNHTTYCPACLLDDRTEEPNGERVGRLSWMFAPVRVCPRHGIFLSQRKSAGYPGRFQDMNIVAHPIRILLRRLRLPMKLRCRGCSAMSLIGCPENQVPVGWMPRMSIRPQRLVNDWVFIGFMASSQA